MPTHESLTDSGASPGGHAMMRMRVASAISSP
jgi:hypothetical protein